MKFTVVAVLVIIGVVNAEYGVEKRGVLRRSTRQAMNSMGGAMLAQTEKNIILNCRNNGLSSSKAIDLQDTYNSMKQCVSRKTIFKTPKEEYINHIIDCSKTAIEKTKSCLAYDQQYFPDFILELCKSMITFMYDDKELFQNFEVITCINNLSKYEILVKYFQCLKDTSEKTHDDQNIPRSKDEFCRKFVPAVDCFPDTLKKYCADTSSNNQFLADYKYAMDHPCDVNNKISYLSESNKL